HSSAIHALKRRHGILASDLAIDEAVDLAHEFADRGQAVSLIEQDDRLDFGEAIDVVKVKFEDGTMLRFSTFDGTVARKFKHLIALGCGTVLVEGAAHGRDVVDLYFAEPGRHMRIWRNTLMASPPFFSGKGDTQAEFHSLARE